MPSVSLFGAAPRVTNIVLRQQFTGDGAATTFQLTSSVGNCTFNKGVWVASRIRTAYPAHVTGTDKKPTYDSVVYLVRNRIGVTSIDSSGLVTLDHTPRNGVDFYVWYWYRLQPHDEVDTYREDFVASMEAEAAAHAAEIVVDVTNFDGILSATDTTLQQALETIDDHTHSIYALKTITLTAGIGLTGGGDLSANRSFALSIDSLTADGSPDGAADYVVTYDADAATHKKVLLDDLPGGGGGSGTIDDGTAAGQMAYWDHGNSKWTYTETSELFWDDTNKRLGIGTATPSYALGISGSCNLITVGTHEYQIGGNRALAMPVNNTNIAIGSGTMTAITTAQKSVAIGYTALTALTEGSWNAGIGYEALLSVTTGVYNVGIGYRAGCGITGNSNIAIGADSQRYMKGGGNISIGHMALQGVEGVSDSDENVVIGNQSGKNIETGSNNAIVGNLAGNGIVDGGQNVVIGNSSLTNSDVTGFIVIGYQSAQSAAATGTQNIVIGNGALTAITSADYTVAIGPSAGAALTSPDGLILIGKSAGAALTTGTANVAIGSEALYRNSTGIGNTALGHNAIRGAAGNSCNYNTAVGAQAKYGITTGGYNVAIGNSADQSNQTGSNNIAIGYWCMLGAASTSHSNNVAIGHKSMLAVTTGGNNICMGYQAGDLITTGTDNIIIGYNIDPSANNATYELNIGNTLYGAVNHGNAGVGGLTFDASARNIFQIYNSTQPSGSLADTVQLYEKDSSQGAGHGTLGLYLEEVVEDIGSFSADKKIRVWLNGTEYRVALEAV